MWTNPSPSAGSCQEVHGGGPETISSPPPLSWKRRGSTLLITGKVFPVTEPALSFLPILLFLVPSCLHPHITQTLPVKIAEDLECLKALGKLCSHLTWMLPTQQHLMCSVAPCLLLEALTQSGLCVPWSCHLKAPAGAGLHVASRRHGCYCCVSCSVVSDSL